VGKDWRGWVINHREPYVWMMFMTLAGSQSRFNFPVTAVSSLPVMVGEEVLRDQGFPRQVG